MSLIKCPECQKLISEAAHACPGCGFTLTPDIVAAQQEDKEAKERAGKSGCFVICILFVILLVYYHWPSSPIPLDNADRAYMRMRMRELDDAEGEILRVIKFRASYGGLQDEINLGGETWGSRFNTESSNNRQLKAAFQESLRLGVKVAPPDWFKNSNGYSYSPDKSYFTD